MNRKRHRPIDGRRRERLKVEMLRQLMRAVREMSIEGLSFRPSD